MRHTLARPGEIRDLRWRDYHADTKLLCLSSFKAKKRRKDGVAVRAIPVDPYLQRLLQRWKSRRSPLPEHHLFVNQHGKPYTGSAIRLAIKRAAMRAGLVADGEEAVVPYTMRHTAATFATKAGVRDRVLATIMGHTSTRTTARYQHLDVAELGGAIEVATSRGRNK
jgi:integrase